MGQMGFFDTANRYAALEAKNDPLARIDEVVPWEALRPRLETVWCRPPEERNPLAGRKPWDAVVMFTHPPGPADRDTRRKIDGDGALQEIFAVPIGRASQIRGQKQRQRGWKLYSWHAPETECIGKGTRP